jgi:ADP-heptose:LPS heptosyltransferase
VVVHPGARLPSRRWPVERFAQVASGLAAEGWPVLITGSPAEAEVTGALAAMLGKSACDLTGKTTLGGLAALVADARLLVCNDTGLAHVASAVRTPAVIVASGSEVARWAPLNRGLHPVLHDDPPCRPCVHAVCPTGHECARAITAEQVQRAVRSQLMAEHSHAG